MENVLRALVRPVRLIAAGGTIAMSGARAVPALDAAGLIEAVPPLAAVPELAAENVLSRPGPQITQPEALRLVRRAVAVAAQGTGVVITTGTDTLEELAVLAALLHGAAAPIVLTGANRPASRPGADGPANLLDAVAVAGARVAEGLGAVVVFGGEIHAATTARKVDSTAPNAFGSPATGPLGRVVEGRIWLGARPLPRTPLSPETLDGRVPIITCALGDDGSLLRNALRDCDGAVVVCFGAGHVTPGILAAIREASVPVLLTGRPERAQMLFSTYGFEGSEPDLRDSGAIPVPFLSAAGARMALLACLGAGLTGPALAAALASWDASALPPQDS
ncbi:MAG TPA: asparaginase domain-containing protein [Solirubrobacteraceae bacterium]|nr:asparaginase domain-containing protein [Solirubrobacteraceae bacterium]